MMPSAPSASQASLLDVPVNASWGPVACDETVGFGVPPPETGGLVAGGFVPGAVVVVVVPGAAFTTTVPVMFECTRQWYEKLPACVNTCENELPGLMHGPVGQVGLESNAPVSEVTLWITAPVLVHVTVLPAETVIVEGENPKSTIDTWTVAALPGRTGWNGSTVGGTVVGAVVAGVDVVVVVVPGGRCGADGPVMGVRSVAGVATVADAAVSCPAPKPMPATHPATTPMHAIHLRRRLMCPLVASMSASMSRKIRTRRRLRSPAAA
jgi:hypothetical protein